FGTISCCRLRRALGPSLLLIEVVRSLLSLRRSTHHGFLLSFLLHVCVFYFQYLLCHAVCLGDLLNICMSC
uniref:Uncharacterized protein n=1 Tax=Aegilops tauschii subsp. strangulata TaxID=200361 RepID=A0A453HW41_AEGTS